ncbi:DUF1549 domain-containing protein [Alienimonas californiensis]|uniref:Cytochrome c domain-containing protein n=1 Tax=Alienimonas californiensis TaxID=2527989 RepID=A0A517PD69_9PLAN|nr:DUF1549 domain-containing protein [Alienimonas californiensis]QDT17323.1 hypothetical protein CA12_34430 [Alienimonas californiensis]
MSFARPSRRWLALAAVGAVCAATFAAAARDVSPGPPPLRDAPDPAAIDGFFHERWTEEDVEPAPAAEELLVLRRLSLALHGTIPSLEEVRAFEADARPDRLTRWTDRLLADRRFAEYWAERLARALVGVHEGNLVLFRRDRFKAWLADRLHRDAPWDETVRRMIAGDGIWTARPEVNFVTAEVENDRLDREALAGRTVRAFLGQRIDCAQCHDHPFAEWSQGDFEGLAAFYGRTAYGLTGVRERTREKGGPKEFAVQDRETLEDRVVAPAVPFAPERLPADYEADSTDRRRALAAWVTHPDNRRFGRATANRAWGLLFGRAWKEPVDDLPDPEPLEPGEAGDLLDRLAASFAGPGEYRLKRLIRTIAASRAFRLSSSAPGTEEAEYERLARAGAVFPLTRLRPEQMIGAMTQAGSVRTLDADSPLFVRAIRFFRTVDFVRNYGDLGEEELIREPGTVPQALLRMNGRLPREIASAQPLGATARLSWFAGPPPRQVEAAFLCTLTRRPTEAETAALAAYYEPGEGKAKAPIEDVYWTLFNAPEFSWNH